MGKNPAGPSWSHKTVSVLRHNKKPWKVSSFWFSPPFRINGSIVDYKVEDHIFHTFLESTAQRQHLLMLSENRFGVLGFGNECADISAASDSFRLSCRVFGVHHDERNWDEAGGKIVKGTVEQQSKERETLERKNRVKRAIGVFLMKRCISTGMRQRVVIFASFKSPILGLTPDFPRPPPLSLACFPRLAPARWTCRSDQTRRRDRRGDFFQAAPRARARDRGWGGGWGGSGPCILDALSVVQSGWPFFAKV